MGNKYVVYVEDYFSFDVLENIGVFATESEAEKVIEALTDMHYLEIMHDGRNKCVQFNYAEVPPCDNANKVIEEYKKYLIEKVKWTYGGDGMSREDLKRKGYTDEEIEEIIMIYEMEMQYENTNDNISENEV